MELKEILSKRLETLIEKKKDENYQNSIPKQADGMGIPYPTFVKYINGKAECPASNIIKIARYYGVSTDYLLGNSPNPTTDEKLQGVCKYTGLSQKAVENLIENANRTDIRYISFLLEYGFLRGFFNEFSLYVNSDKITVPKNNNELSEILFDSDDKKLGDYIKDDNNFTNHINMRCSYPLQLNSSFDTGIFEKAVILEMQDRLRMIKDDITKSIKDGVKNG